MSASCLLVTFNCAKRAQSSGEIQYLLESALESSPNDPDFVVFGLQEAASLLDGSLGRLDEWLAPFITAATNVANGTYSLVARQHVGAIALLVFGSGRVNAQRVVKRKTQFGMLWSSFKGAACISLLLEGETSNERITFVSAHLAANEGRVTARNHDFALLHEALGLQKLNGQVFIMGDLNYRATDRSFDSDELTIEMREGRAAWGFTEAPVKFEPSFKYIVGTSEFDTKRSPSWCDRVLYRPHPDIRFEAYENFKSHTASDHKPVFLAINTPTTLSAPSEVPAPPAVSLPPAWLPGFVDRTMGSALFVGTTRSGWVIIGLVVAVFFFIWTL